MRFSKAGRYVVAAGVAASLFFGTAACGAKVDKDKLVAKLRTEDDFKALNDKQLDCFADVMIDHAKGGDLVDYVDGKKSLDDVKGDDEKETTSDAEKCATS